MFALSNLHRPKAPLCKGSCREATEGLQNCRFYRKFSSKRNIFNPSVTAPPCHLPLHKGGFSAYRIGKQFDKLKLAFRLSWAIAHHFNPWRSHTSIIHQRSDFNIHYSFALTERQTVIWADLPLRGKKGGLRFGGPHGIGIVYFSFWSRTMMTLATCARVAVPKGFRVSLVTPLTMPSPMAHANASTA